MQFLTPPLVTIIITSYNRAGMVGKAIESSLAQDYPNLEIIVSDNCSTDNSDEVIRSYCSDPRIRYFRNPENIGMLGNFRKATFEYADGELITYVSSDDYLCHHSFISEAVQFFQQDKDCSLVFGRMMVRNIDSGNEWVYPESPFYLRPVWTGLEVFLTGTGKPLFSCCACVMKRDNLKKVNAYHTDYVGFDIENNYKMMLYGTVAFINKVTYVMIGHSDNNTFPKDPDRVIRGYDCFENIYAYATALESGHKEQFLRWKESAVYALISWGFHAFSRKGGVNYFVFQKETKAKYPGLMKKFKKSRAYKRMILVNVLKKVIPENLIARIRK